MGVNESDAVTAPAESCDVLVIGGGPGGSTAATLLARRGWNVLLLEKAHHPRFHIGESLLPMNLPVLQRLGVMEKVHALGVYKRGADFEADTSRGYRTYAFARALGQSPSHAYQVRRQDFDAMLFDHARTSGVETHDGVEVVAVEQVAARDTRVRVRADDGRAYQVQTRYLLDASGRDAFVASQRHIRHRHPRHRSVAMFGHFLGARRREGADAGNISIYYFDHGWMWMIPLPDGVMSVGAVCQPGYMKQRRAPTREFLFETLKRNVDLWARVRDAQLLDDTVHAAGNYSYSASTIGGRGWMLVGDAFAFLDPVFSSGVFLAMNGAEQTAALVHAALEHPSRERRLQRRLEKRLRAGMARMAFFIERFNSPVMQQMFRQPRNTWQVEQGVISMLAGDVFDARNVRWRLQLFRIIYGICALRDWRHWRAERRTRRRQNRMDD